jgi:lipopolysaccharide transport system ATP-binding protein
MPDISGTQRSVTGLHENVVKPAVRFSGVRKEYRLYDSVSEQAIDVLGLSWLRFWRPTRYRTFTALDGINLEIRHGERVGIVGRNGAGKTTLLKLITGNFRPTAGKIEVNGDVQALMQTGLGFHGEFTGYENIKSSLIYNGLTGNELDRAVKDIIEFCELGDFVYRPVKTYSLGMRARLQFAAATAIKPDIVIVDEVLGAGDAYFTAKCSERMDRLTRSGCTMLLVSHSMQQVVQFCNRCIWVDEGKVRMDGDVRGVVGAYEVMVAKDIKERIKVEPGNGKREAALLEKEMAEAGSQVGKGEYFKERLESGLTVFRWPSNIGVKIVDLKVSDLSGDDFVFHSGGSLKIELVMECEVSGDINVATHIAVFGEAGVRVAWITSPVDRFRAEVGERRLVTMAIGNLLLSGGNFTLSISVFDGTKPDVISVGTRFDLLARCYNFSVIDKDLRPKPVFFHPSQWTFERTNSPAKYIEKGEKKQG